MPSSKIPFWPVHNLMMRTLEGEGVTFDDVLIDRSFPEENLPTRKPGTAMLGRYTSGGYDMEACWVIGDRETDAQLALNLGCRALILKEKDEDSFFGRAHPLRGQLGPHCRNPFCRRT